jgi:NADH dehydrogenase
MVASKNQPHRIVIVGGGSGGLKLATRLGHRYRRDPSVRVTLVDAALTHVWKPLFHEVAAGTLDVRDD